MKTNVVNKFAKRFFETTFIYLIGQILSKLVSFFLLPLYTANLLPSEMGSYDIVITIINLVVPVVFLQAWDGAFRFAFDSENALSKNCLINNSLGIFVIGVIPCSLIMILLTRNQGMAVCSLIVIYALLYCLQYIYTFSSRIFMDNALFVISGVAASLCTALLNVLLIVKYNYGVESLYIAHIAGIVVQIAIIEVKLKLIPAFKICDISIDTIKKIIRFSAPLCLATISYWLLSGFTRIMIQHSLGDAANGLYAVANKIATLITFIMSAIQFAWNEIAYLTADNDDKKGMYTLFIDGSMKAVAYGCAIVCLIIKIIFPIVIDAQYADSLPLIPIVMIGVAFNSIASLISTLFMVDKNTKFILLSTLISATLNIILCLVGHKHWDLLGFSAILSTSFLTLMVIRLIKASKMELIAIKAQSLIDWLACVVALLAFNYINETWILIIICLIFLGTFIIRVRKDAIAFMNSKGIAHEIG